MAGLRRPHRGHDKVYTIYRRNAQTSVHTSVAALGSRPIWWTPSWTRIFPPHHWQPWFLLYWLLDRLRLFKNAHYAVLLIQDDSGRFIHRTCIYPAWSRFPFMGRSDVQLGYMFTAPSARRKGLASYALTQCFERLNGRAGQVFFITDAGNTPAHRLASNFGFEPMATARKVPLDRLGYYAVEPSPFSSPGNGRLKVWLLTVGEPLPVDPGRERPLRTGIVANLLAQKGVDVVWWSANFRHTQKRMRFGGTTTVRMSPNLKLWCLDSRVYSNNVSLRRILAHRDMADEFRRRALYEAPPHVLIASYPTPELANAAACYAERHDIPSIVDIRDLWPDIWPSVLPQRLQFLRPAAEAFLVRFGGAASVLRRFTSICGITEQIVQWGIDHAGRDRTKWDRAFPLAYPEIGQTRAELEAAKEFWSKRLGPTPADTLTLCFFGTMTSRTRVDVLVEAVKALAPDIRARTRIVLCGVGPTFEELRQRATDLPGIIFPGWVNGPQIQALASISAAGLLPYPSEADFRRSIPNKVIEYLAHGLPIITSLHGPVTDLIRTEQCGLIYRETDPQDLARIIEHLHAQPAELSRMSSRARDVFERNFRSEAVYGALIDMTINLTRKPPLPNREP